MIRLMPRVKLPIEAIRLSHLMATGEKCECHDGKSVRCDRWCESAPIGDREQPSRSADV